MLDQMNSRLTELEQEFLKGENRLRALLQEEADLRQTLIRISGAVQVLQELVAGHGTATEPCPTSEQA
ncbi:hypothetical protein AB0442_35815 [Kitasatospora sp. NPDC085895]|uniref:hypothetical protein n=1 Tax=Kitasatospora sp. NPDC085895 TaxID=3155057 RepID=UPI003450E262